ncbi:MAG: hypothetical protein GXP27_12745, partial [Planctomycetes bacterium]|nr:hypothetical protein [Planctomycetota bacterium]
MNGKMTLILLVTAWLAAASGTVRAQTPLAAAPRSQGQRPPADALDASPPFGAAPARRPSAGFPMGGPSHRGHTSVGQRPSTEQRLLPQQQLLPQSPGAAGSVVIPTRHRRPRRIRDYSWIYIDAPEPREIKVHDIITIIVDEKAEVTVNSRFDRQRNSNLNAELNEFIRLGETG